MDEAGSAADQVTEYRNLVQRDHVDDRELFPKLFSGEYGAEISILLTSKSQIIHSSFYDGDLEAFIYLVGAPRAEPAHPPCIDRR